MATVFEDRPLPPAHGCWLRNGPLVSRSGMPRWMTLQEIPATGRGLALAGLGSLSFLRKMIFAIASLP